VCIIGSIILRNNHYILRSSKVNMIPTAMHNYRMYYLRKMFVKIQLDYCKHISKIVFERVPNSKPDI